MRTITLILSLLCVALMLPRHARGADGASVHAIMINASKEKAAADPRLAPYEATLQRNLPESSFRFSNDGRATLGGKGNHAIIALGSHRIELEGGSRDADGIRIKVRWLSGNSVVMSNTFSFQPGVPVVLGLRPSNDTDIPIVIIIAN
jgi:hypothetical protein